MKRIILFILILVVQTSHSQNNWLSKIEDSREIANISIPGTHNSATGDKLKYGIGLGVTQRLSIEEQWDMGIRAFDLRPDIKDGEMNIYHGALKTRITFPEAIETILKAKGFNYSVVVIGDDDVNVVTLGKELETGETAQIRDAIISQTNLSAGKIKIITISKTQILNLS